MARPRFIYAREHPLVRKISVSQTDAKKVSSFASIFVTPRRRPDERTHPCVVCVRILCVWPCLTVSPRVGYKNRKQKLRTSCCFTATELWMVAISQIKPYCPDILMVGKGINLFHTDFISIPIIDHIYRVIKKRSDLQKNWILLPAASVESRY